MERLSEQTLTALPPSVAGPKYDRRQITNGIVHIGVGGFHRAHEAVYTDDILGGKNARSWSICGVGLRPADRPMRDALVPQDCLYTVVSRSAEGDTARVIGALTRFLFAPEEGEAVLEALAAPETKIVSLTITEGGYNFNGATGEFQADAPEIVRDLHQPQTPVSVFGYLAEAFARRHRRGLAGVTVLSCDNVPENGDMAKKTLLAFAALREPALAEWIAQNCTFPNSMVDRITPQTTDADRALVRQEFGIEDAWPVVCEPFGQWIIEDRFAAGRPPWEQAGAQFTADVHPYELMKLRLLNASHSAMAYLGFLAGFEFVPEVMADAQFSAYIRRLMDDEVTPLLAPVPGIDLAEYKATLLTRFANPAIKDQIVRLCLDGSSKLPKFLLPSLHESLAAGRAAPLLTLAVAGWMRYLRGEDAQGRAYTVQDPRADELSRVARAGGPDPRPLLAVTDIFGTLGQSAPFTAQLAALLTQIDAQGARAALANALL